MARPPLASSRAAASPGGRTGADERILYVTPGYRLIALDAKTGVPVPTFGKAGVVDLKLDDDQQIDLVTGEVGLHATPLVAGNTVIVGAAHLAGGEPKSKTNVKGYVRGFDVKTGKRLWIFHTIPKPGEFGYNTWEKDSAEYTGNTGVWAQISVDEDLGMAYLPVELPTGDYYGGHRPGNGLVRRKYRGCGSENRAAQVALPTGASRTLGHGHSVRAHVGRYHGEWPAREGARAADQAVDPLCVQPRDGAAHLADRREACSTGRRARRMVFAHAADSDQTPALWAQRVFRGRRDRFHARAEGAGAAADFEIQDWTAFYAPGGEQGRGAAGHAGYRLLPGRHQLGGRIVRSADAPLICIWQVGGGQPRSGAAPGGRVGYEFRPGIGRFRWCASACR